MKRFFNNPFKKKHYIVLIDDEPIMFEESQTVDIILSPKYYWTKKESLPVKYEYQAKAYARSTFEDIIPEGKYNYLVKKKENGFQMYAYNDSYILSEIEKLGIKPQQIGRVFFAQNELTNIEIPIKINKHEALMIHDESIIKVPMRLVDESIDFSDYFKSHELSNFHVNLNKFNQIIDFKAIYTLAAILLVFILFYGIEFIWLGKTKEKYEEKRASIAKRYHMPSTSLQTKALMNQLDKKMNTQQKLREKIYDITKLPLGKDSFMKDIKYNGKKFTLAFSIKDKNQIQEVQNYLQKNFKMENINKQGDIVTFEVHYD